MGFSHSTCFPGLEGGDGDDRWRATGRTPRRHRCHLGRQRSSNPMRIGTPNCSRPRRLLARPPAQHGNHFVVGNRSEGRHLDARAHRHQATPTRRGVFMVGCTDSGSGPVTCSRYYYRNAFDTATVGTCPSQGSPTSSALGAGWRSPTVWAAPRPFSGPLPSGGSRRRSELGPRLDAGPGRGSRSWCVRLRSDADGRVRTAGPHRSRGGALRRGQAGGQPSGAARRTAPRCPRRLRRPPGGRLPLVTEVAWMRAAIDAGAIVAGVERPRAPALDVGPAIDPSRIVMIGSSMAPPVAVDWGTRSPVHAEIAQRRRPGSRPVRACSTGPERWAVQSSMPWRCRWRSTPAS